MGMGRKDMGKGIIETEQVWTGCVLRFGAAFLE